MSEWSMSPGDFRYVFRSGLRLQVTPEGDCREATFTAKGEGVGLSPLDAVQIVFDGVPIFYGEVRVGGNPFDVDGHQFTLRSMALGLREVTIPSGWSAPQQSAGATVRSLIESVLPQLDGAFTVGQIDLPFDCRAIVNAHHQNPYALLEQIAADGAGLGVKVRFGVNANREFFCVPAREDVAALSSDMLTGQSKWTAPVAEAACTAVRWLLAKKPDGGWVTRLSRAPEASVYRSRVKVLSLTDTRGLWSIAPFTTRASDGVTTLTDDPGIKAALIDGTPKYVSTPTPGLHEYTGASVTLSAETDDGQVYLEQTLSQGADYLRIDVAWINGDPAGNKLVITEPGKPPREFKATDLKRQITGRPLGSTIVQIDLKSTGKVDDKGNVTTTGTGSTTVSLPTDNSVTPPTDGPPKLEFWELAPGTVVRLEGASKPSAEEVMRRVKITLSECRPEVCDPDLLDRLARHHYDIPATAPANLELRGFHPDRAGNVTLGGWQSPVDAWEYRLSADRGMCTGVLAGQRDDPNNLAQAELIRARDQRAVIQAITSAT
ncbi:hypothetical protein ACINK0_11355 [Deinococcus sp. VB343]|uniref:hypothetical protein n=1 Tax=Deinococcus sp. VB343 TaxID=3385567 RepID=UPI0039C95B24